MDTPLIVSSLGLLSAIAWGISDFFAAKSSKSIGPVLTALLVSSISCISFMILFGLFFQQSMATLTTPGFINAAASGFFISSGVVAFFAGLKIGPVSIVSPLSSMYPLFTTVIALTLFDAVLSTQQLIGIGLALVGVLVTSEITQSKPGKHRLGVGPLLALLTALCWGVGYTLLAQSMKTQDWQVSSLINYAFSVITLLLLLPAIKGGEVINRKTVSRALRNRYVIGTSLVQLIGVGALEIGISKSTASNGAIVTAISASYPVLTVILALKHFGEKTRFIPLAGAAIGIAGIVILSLG